MNDPRVIAVTGATSGIGREIASQLNRRGHQVVMLGRDTGKLASTRAELETVESHGPIETGQVDLSSQSSIRDFAAVFCRDHPRLDALVNCAGIYVRKREESVDGIELVFATNVLGPHLLTMELLPLLRAGAPARVVVVASEFAGELDLDDLPYAKTPYKGTIAYQRSKQANRMWTRALARRVRDDGITVNSMAPGFVYTNLYRNAPWWLRPVLWAVGITAGRPVAKGADTAVWLAGSPDVEGKTGGYYKDRTRLPCPFDDDVREERLWAECKRLTGRSM